MEILCLTVGDLATNCYLVTDEETRHTLIIDPGDEGDFISTAILENKLIPKAVILTHGHYDHCLAVLELKLNFSLPIYLHPKDLFLYKKAHLSASYWSPTSPLKGRFRRGRGSIPHLPPIDHFLNDQEIITFGNSSLKVLHTPGHTPGSICLLSSSTTYDLRPTTSLFTGDTLFVNGVGSTNHSYSSKSDLQKSLHHLQSTIHALPNSPLIYPGHEDFGTVFP